MNPNADNPAKGLVKIQILLLNMCINKFWDYFSA